MQQLNPLILHKPAKTKIGGSGDRIEPYRWSALWVGLVSAEGFLRSTGKLSQFRIARRERHPEAGRKRCESTQEKPETQGPWADLARPCHRGIAVPGSVGKARLGVAEKVVRVVAASLGCTTPRPCTPWLLAITTY